MSGPKPLGEAEIDLAAVEANVRTVASIAGTNLMAVVKADGFGHGAVPVARAALAAGATWLGVTSTAEALDLRSAGVAAPMLSWLHRPDEDFAPLIGATVDVGVSTLPRLHAIADAARRLGVPGVVQLKVDTGLSRNGAVSDDLPDLFAWARKYEVEGYVRVRGVWSHLANAGRQPPGRADPAFRGGPPSRSPSGPPVTTPPTPTRRPPRGNTRPPPAEGHRRGYGVNHWLPVPLRERLPT